MIDVKAEKKAIADSIKIIMNRKGISTYDISEKSSTSTTFIYNLLNEQQSVSIDNLFRVLKACGIRIRLERVNENPSNRRP